MKKNLQSVVKAIIGLILVNVVAGFIHLRFDLTEDQRYTLSQPAVTLKTR